MTLHCWWFGCERHEQDPRAVDEVTCVRCDELISYADLVGDTRHYRFVKAIKRWIPRWPSKCPNCGARFGRHRGTDCDIPF